MRFLRNLLSHVPKAAKDMVAAAMKAVFVIQAPDQVRAHWQRVTAMLRKQFPAAVPVMEAARNEGLLRKPLRRQGSNAGSSPRCSWLSIRPSLHVRGRGQSGHY